MLYEVITHRIGAEGMHMEDDIRAAEQFGSRSHDFRSLFPIGGIRVPRGGPGARFQQDPDSRFAERGEHARHESDTPLPGERFFGNSYNFV